MMKPYRLIGFVLIGLAATTVTGVICQVRRKNMLKRLLQASDEGYETAHDIIYPGKLDTKAPENLKYGPYIPKYF